MKVFLLALCLLVGFGTPAASETIFSEICTLLDQINEDIKATLNAVGQSFQQKVDISLIPKFLDVLSGPGSLLSGLAERNVSNAIDVDVEYSGKVLVFFEAILTAFYDESFRTILSNLNQTIDEEFPGQLTSYCAANLSDKYENKSFETCFREYELSLIETSQKAEDAVVALLYGSFQALDNLLAPLFLEMTSLVNGFMDNLNVECGSNDTCIVQNVIESNLK